MTDTDQIQIQIQIPIQIQQGTEIQILCLAVTFARTSELLPSLALAVLSLSASQPPARASSLRLLSIHHFTSSLPSPPLPSPSLPLSSQPAPALPIGKSPLPSPFVRWSIDPCHFLLPRHTQPIATAPKAKGTSIHSVQLALIPYPAVPARLPKSTALKLKKIPWRQ